jgi:hypothetical protein
MLANALRRLESGAALTTAQRNELVKLLRRLLPLDARAPVRRGRKSGANALRDWQIVQAYQLMLDEYETVAEAVRKYPNDPDLARWKGRLPRNKSQRFEQLSRVYFVSTDTVRKIVDRDNRAVRRLRRNVTLGADQPDPQ